MPILKIAFWFLVSTGADWSVEVSSPELTVWSRENGDSGQRESKARWFIDVPPERVWSVIEDVNEHATFMPHLSESRVVDREDDGAIFLYQRLKLPLVDDRDYTVRVTHRVDAAVGTYRQSWTSANHRGPRASDAIRLERVEGAWTLERAENGGTWVSYWLHAAPGGALPRWIVRLANRRGIPALMRALATRVTHYAGAAR